MGQVEDCERGSPARWMNRAGGGAEADAESAGDDLGEGGFAGSRLVRPRGCGHGLTRFPWATSVRVDTLAVGQRAQRPHSEDAERSEGMRLSRGAQPVLKKSSLPSPPYNPLDCRVPLASLGLVRMTARRHRNQRLTLSPPSKRFVFSICYHS